MSAKVSIIVPIYNTECYLARCINSILDQSYMHLEIILVNDGSTDGSAQLCDSFAAVDSRIKIIHKENGGVSSARNSGIEISSGDWVTFVDSDDYIDSDFIENMMKYADCDFVASHIKAEGWKEWVDIPLETNKWERTHLKDFIQNNLNRMNFMVCKLFKKTIIDDFSIRFDKSISYGEDTLFVYKYLKHINSAATISKASYHYNCYNTSSLSKKTISWSGIDYTINRVCQAIEEIEEEFDCNSQYAKSIIVNNYLSSYIQSISQTLSFSGIYKSLKEVNKNVYVVMQVSDKTSWAKSRKRLFFDLLLQNKLYFLCSLMLYFSRYFN